jgi:iron(III) transport system ATP-binding protein
MSLELRELRKRFGEVEAVRGLDLELRSGELMTLLGPSGCGKTTVLRLIAGFEAPDEGRILFHGEDVTGQPPQRRGFGMVFQNYALFPHLSVFENVAFGLKAHGQAAEEIGARVERTLARVDLPGFGGRRVQELSGGQQQRVALARALAIEPPLLLLDEPLSNLDAVLRERTRVELREILKAVRITALYVTHDQEEAFDLADRIAVMEGGRLRQVGTPEDLYDRPVDRFVAGFVGRANVLSGRLEAGPLGVPSARLKAGPAWPITSEAGRGEPGRSVELVIRPEHLLLVTGSEAAAGGEAAAASEAGVGSEAAYASAVLPGVVRERLFRGASITYRVEIADGTVLEVEAERDAAAPGERVAVRPRPGARVHAFPA